MIFEQRLKEAEDSLGSGGQKAFPLDALFSVFDTALQLWLSKEKTKYVDRKIALLKDWYEEYNRPDHSRLALDQIETQMKILSIAFVSAVKAGD